MPNDYKDIYRSIKRLEKAISKLSREFSSKSDIKDISRIFEKQLREFQKSNRFEIQKEIGNSK